MRQVREVLRLKHAAGASARHIAASLGISRSTVAEYLRRAAVVGITWPVPDELCARQVIALEGHRIAVAVLGNVGLGSSGMKALASRVRERRGEAKIVCGCADAAENPTKAACGSVIWPRTACPELLADIVAAMIEDEKGTRKQPF